MSSAARTALTRQRVLDAAERLLWSDGLRALSLAQVATEARISRAWLYQLFPNKRSLVLATMLRFDEAYWTAAHIRVGQHDDLGHQVAEAVVMAREVERGPLVIHLQTTEPEALATIVGSDVRAIEPAMLKFWVRHVEAGVDAGLLRADLDVDAAAAWVLRIVVSLVVIPLGELDVDDVHAVAGYLKDTMLRGLAITPEKGRAP